MTRVYVLIGALKGGMVILGVYATEALAHAASLHMGKTYAAFSVEGFEVEG